MTTIGTADETQVQNKLRPVSHWLCCDFFYSNILGFSVTGLVIVIALHSCGMFIPDMRTLSRMPDLGNLTKSNDTERCILKPR